MNGEHEVYCRRSFRDRTLLGGEAVKGIHVFRHLW